MRELFKEASKITNYNIILAIPLIVFVKVLDLYSFFSRYHADTAPKLLLASLTVLFMGAVFCAAWFYMVKGAINLSKKVFVLDADRANASMNLFKSIPEGIGKYFLSFVGVYVIFFFIQIIATPIVYILGRHLIGRLDEVSTQNLITLANDPNLATNAGMANFIEKLTPEQIVFLGKWSLLFMLATSVVMYLLMLWIPEIIYKNENPFIALGKSVAKLFKDFFNTGRLFLSLWFMGFALLFINTFAMLNPVAYILVSILMFYFTVYITVLIFLYYDKKYMVQDEK